MTIITPETHPNHHIVGHLFAFSDFEEPDWPTAYWYCDSYDPKLGYWLTRTDKPERRKNVSEGAIHPRNEILFSKGLQKFYCHWLRKPWEVDAAKLGDYAKFVEIDY